MKTLRERFSNFYEEKEWSYLVSLKSLSNGKVIIGYQTKKRAIGKTRWANLCGYDAHCLRLVMWPHKQRNYEPDKRPVTPGWETAERWKDGKPIPRGNNGNKTL